MHESRDRLLARRIAGDLVAHGISARADIGEMAPGETFERWLDRGVGGASVFLVLLSGSSGDHLRAITPPVYPRTSGKHTWRAIVGCLGPVVLPPSLAEAQAIDLSDYDTGLARLVAAL